MKVALLGMWFSPIDMETSNIAVFVIASVARQSTVLGSTRMDRHGLAASR